MSNTLSLPSANIVLPGGVTLLAIEALQLSTGSGDATTRRQPRRKFLFDAIVAGNRSHASPRNAARPKSFSRSGHADQRQP